MSDSETPKHKRTAPSGSKPGPARASWLSAILLMAPLSVFAELLITKTHHRPLGGATFATVALIAWGLSELVTRKVLDRSQSPGRARARNWVWIVSALLGVAVVGRALL